jgi:hypothetical protein
VKNNNKIIKNGGYPINNERVVGRKRGDPKNRKRIS